MQDLDKRRYWTTLEEQDFQERLEHFEEIDHDNAEWPGVSSWSMPDFDDWPWYTE